MVFNCCSKTVLKIVNTSINSLTLEKRQRKDLKWLKYFVLFPENIDETEDERERSISFEDFTFFGYLLPKWRF